MAHRYGSNVPEARAKLLEIERDLRNVGLHEVADRIARVRPLLVRRAPARRVSPKSPSVSPEVAEAMRRLARTTDLTQAEIASRFGVNPGRVSEVLSE